MRNTRLDPIPWEREHLDLVFDYETSGLHPDDGARPSTLGLKWGPGPNEHVAIPTDQGVLDKPDTQPTLFGDAPNIDRDDWDRIHHWMSRQNLIGHGAKFDLWMAWTPPRGSNSRHDLSRNLYWDTMVVESLLEPNERVAIEKAAERHGIPTDPEIDQKMKAWARNNKVGGVVRYDLAPWDILEPYLTADLQRTWDLYTIQKDRIREGEIPRALLDREIRLVRLLFDMERRGLPYDTHQSLQAGDQATLEIGRIHNELPFDPHSKDQTAQALMQAGIRLERTETGQWSVDQAATQRAADAGVPWAPALQRWTKLQTARNLWYYGWAHKTGVDGRIRADYKQVKTWEGARSSGTVSGRFAVGRVNVQAIPQPRQIPSGYPPMQSLIRADPPKAIYEADISQAEMRVVATLAGCTAMLDGFREGLDAHDSTTQLIWGIDKDHEDWGRYRQVAKRLGFGVVYGAGIKTLADQIRIHAGQDLGEHGVRELWDRYRTAFPQLFRYSRSCQNQVERTGRLVLPGGKVRKFHPNESTHKAMNAMIQGGVAVAMTAAMIAIDDEQPDIIVGQVHDSVLLECEWPYEAQRAADTITKVFEHWFAGCPFTTEVSPYSQKR
jgi:DNA polymerase I-like protein with 3'-5' exonuclease and polymerase domains